MIIVMGAPGAGKSTVLQKAIEGTKGWRVLNWGDRMIELAKERGFCSSRDEMRKLPVEKQAALQEAVADSFAKEAGKWILDTHCSINTPAGYYPGLPFRLLGKLKVDGLVLVEAPVKDIMRRRSADTSRVRDAQEKAGLEEHLSVNRSLLAAYSAFSGAPAVIIENADGKLDAAVAKLNALLK